MSTAKMVIHEQGISDQRAYVRLAQPWRTTPIMTMTQRMVTTRTKTIVKSTETLAKQQHQSDTRHIFVSYDARRRNPGDCSVIDTRSTSNNSMNCSFCNRTLCPAYRLYSSNIGAKFHRSIFRKQPMTVPAIVCTELFVTNHILILCTA